MKADGAKPKKDPLADKLSKQEGREVFLNVLNRIMKDDPCFQSRQSTENPADNPEARPSTKPQ